MANHVEIDTNFADDVEINNKNGTLKSRFIQRVPPRAYNIGNREMGHVIAEFQSQALDIHGTSHVTLLSDQNQNIALNKLNTHGNSKVNVTNTIEENNISLNASGNSRLICKDVKGQANVNLNTLGHSSIQTGAVSSKDICLNSSGNSKIKINTLNATTTSANGSGHSKIFIDNGKTEQQTLNFEGNTKYQAQNLETTNTKVNAKGLSKLFIKVITTLTGKASGNSKIEYQGNPQVNIKLSGLAKYKPRF